MCDKINLTSLVSLDNNYFLCWKCPTTLEYIFMYVQLDKFTFYNSLCGQSLEIFCLSKFVVNAFLMGSAGSYRCSALTYEKAYLLNKICNLKDISLEEWTHYTLGNSSVEVTCLRVLRLGRQLTCQMIGECSCDNGKTRTLQHT